MFMRGVWQHRRLKHKDRPWLAWQRDCLHWNYYVSSKYPAKTPPVKVQIDVKCKGCGERVRFNPYRNKYIKGSGPIRQVRWIDRPNHMPRYALRKESEARNTLEALNDGEESRLEAQDNP